MHLAEKARHSTNSKVNITPMASEQTNFDTSDAPRKISNKERGCGHLEPNATYLRVDPELISEDGVLPLFVEFETPVKYKEDHFRGWKAFPGIQFEQKHRDKIEISHPDELDLHLERLREDTLFGDHAGERRSTFAHDLLMFVGESYYETAEEFIEEAKTMGANKRIPSNNPPVIDPGRTRVFLIHPNAVNDEYAGIIGYFYPTRVVHTLDSDGEVPQKIQDMAAKNVVDIVERGPEEDAHENLQDFETEGSDSDA